MIGFFIGILYITITGERLFEKNANLLKHIKQIMRKYTLMNYPPEKVYITFNRIFWSSAWDEFNTKTSKRK